MVENISAGRSSNVRRSGRMEGKGTLHWTGTVAGVAAIVGFLVAWPVLGLGCASAVTAPENPQHPGQAVQAEIYSEQTPFDHESNKEIAAQCPAGKRVLGGGGRVNGAEHVVLTRMEPVHDSNGDRYVVAASEDQIGFPGTWSLTSYAICADPLPGLEIHPAPGNLGSDTFQLTLANCPPGKLAIGAGGRIDDGEGQVGLHTQGQGSFFPTGTQAAGLEDSDGFNGLWRVTAFAVCVSQQDASHPQIVEEETNGTPSERNIFAIASCPAGTKATGGAAIASWGAIESVSPDFNRLQINVIARNDSAITGNWNVRAVAFCAP